MTAPTAFPLVWPFGWPRTPEFKRRGSSFRSAREDGTLGSITLAGARDRLETELQRLDGRGPILSTNVELTLSGTPRSGRPEPADVGAACYFRLKGQATVLACDRWTTVAGNVAAIAAHIDALRGMDRWGVGSLEQAFAGYQAIAAPTWRDKLGNCRTLEQAEESWRELIDRWHPDRPGGDSAVAAQLNVAIADARREFRT